MGVDVVCANVEVVCAYLSSTPSLCVRVRVVYVRGCVRRL